MNIDIKKIESSTSLLNRRWKLKNFDEREAIYLSQKFQLKYILGKLLSIRNINENTVEAFLNPNINNTKLLDKSFSARAFVDD